MDTSAAQVPEAPELYLKLLKKCLTRAGFEESYRTVEPPKSSVRRVLLSPFMALCAAFGVKLMRKAIVDPALRNEGKDWPADAECMMGLRRLDNLHQCIVDILRDKVPGDLIETGVWRGGGTIFMRAALAAYGDGGRLVWVADSFEGLPKPNEELYPADRGDRHWTRVQLAISMEAVKANFEKYGLLDSRVRFLKGWFKDTLPTAPIERLALLRLDGDMYESTMDALNALYPKLSPGGFVIIDDYGAIPACKAAVEDYRAKHGIREEVALIDWTGAFWRKR